MEVGGVGSAAAGVGTQVIFAGGAGPCNVGSDAIDIYDIDPLVEIEGTSFPEELNPGDKISITVDDVSIQENEFG